MKEVKIGYLYPNELNLYGDNGNVEVLVQRCLRRNINVSVENIGAGSLPKTSVLTSLNLLFMGGGPDSSQKNIYEDFLNVKKPFMKDYIDNGGAGLFVCGSYQLLGRYYKAADGLVLKGLSILDLYTEHFGKNKPRCIGNVRAKLNPKISDDAVFKNINFLDDQIVGFENHGGRTYLGSKSLPLGKVTYGNGNNSEDGTEGVIYKNCIGTYFHGPFLAKNPHIADYFIAKVLNVDNLPILDDKFSKESFSASKKLR